MSIFPWLNSRGMLGIGKVKQTEIHAKVIRANGEVEDLGIIAFWHRNPFKRLAWKLKRKR